MRGFPLISSSWHSANAMLTTSGYGDVPAASSAPIRSTNGHHAAALPPPTIEAKVALTGFFRCSPPEWRLSPRYRPPRSVTTSVPGGQLWTVAVLPAPELSVEIQVKAGVEQHPITPTLTRQELMERLTGVVSERTGYPPEMLNIDADLEADLGIDSIKRVEIFSALQSDSVLSSESGDGDIEALSKLKSYVPSRLYSSRLEGTEDVAAAD